MLPLTVSSIAHIYLQRRYAFDNILLFWNISFIGMYCFIDDLPVVCVTNSSI